MRSGLQTPIRRYQAEPGKDRFGFIDRIPPPAWLLPVRGVPGMRQAPALVEGERGAESHVPICEPLFQVFF